MSGRDLISIQAARAYDRFGDSSMGGTRMSRAERLAVLMEEVGEVAREVVTALRNVSGIEPDRHGAFDRSNLIAELAQVGACAEMWLDAELRAIQLPPQGERGEG